MLFCAAVRLITNYSDLSTEMIQVVRGSAARAIRVPGSMATVLSGLLGLALWLWVKDTTEKKIAVEVAFVIVMVVLIGVVSAAAACTIARVQDGSLDFFFCGMRTRSFPLDGSTTFDLHKIGRLEILRIWQQPAVPTGALDKDSFADLIRGPRKYVPNGALDKDAIVDLLRTNGAVERQAD